MANLVDLDALIRATLSSPACTSKALDDDGDRQSVGDSLIRAIRLALGDIADDAQPCPECDDAGCELARVILALPLTPDPDVRILRRRHTH